MFKLFNRIYLTILELWKHIKDLDLQDYTTIHKINGYKPIFLCIAFLVFNIIQEGYRGSGKYKTFGPD